MAPVTIFTVFISHTYYVTVIMVSLTELINITKVIKVFSVPYLYFLTNIVNTA